MKLKPLADNVVVKRRETKEAMKISIILTAAAK